jgi:PAS domain S-box-containing protein
MILARHSLKTRITLTTLIIFVIGIWSLTYYISRFLREDMERQVGVQQFSTVTFIASYIDEEIFDRLRALEKIAGLLSPAILRDRSALQTYVESRPVLTGLFSAGVFVTDVDGTSIASVPASLGRLGVNYLDRDHVATALHEGKPAISKPGIGKILHKPVFGMAVPIRDDHGNVRGALVGSVDLSVPNFLDRIANSRYGMTGGYVLADIRNKLFVTATDKTFVLRSFPAPGVNPLFDRYIQGYEGSGSVVDSRGVAVLSAAKQIPTAGWLLIARIPTDEAFAPIQAMQQRMLAAALFMTVVIGSLIWWMLSQQLAPMGAAAKALAPPLDPNHPAQPLPIARPDEIGALVGAFNRTLSTLNDREAGLRQSELRFRSLFNNAEVAMFSSRLDGSETLDCNNKFLEIVGRTREEVIGSPSAILWEDPQRRQEMIRLLETAGQVTDFEFNMLNRGGGGQALPDFAKALQGDRLARRIDPGYHGTKKSRARSHAAQRRLGGSNSPSHCRSRNHQ